MLLRNNLSLFAKRPKCGEGVVAKALCRFY
jgi:hypothetical protein